MVENINKDLQTSRIRILPIVFGVLFGVFVNIVCAYSGTSVILSSLGGLAFTVSIFLTLTLVFNEIVNKYKEKGNTLIEASEHTELKTRPVRFVKTRAFFAKLFSVFSIFKFKKAVPGQTLKENEMEAADKETVPGIPSDSSDDLIEINEKKLSKHEQTKIKQTADKFIFLMSALYIVSFIVLAFWHISRSLMIMPLNYRESNNYGMINSVLLLAFPCIAVMYLKMRKDDGSRPGDLTSHGSLMLLSYVSLIYAAVIAAGAVLRINLLIILKWTYYAVSVYFFIALAVNILISILAHKVLGNFNYALLPKTSKADESFLDSEEMRLNFSLKSLWTIKYTLQILPGLILAVVLVLILSTTIFVVLPHQQAAVYRLGKLRDTSIADRGFHFKLPWPIDIVEIHDVHRVKSMQIGYVATNSTNFLWTRPHDGGEYTLLLGSGNEIAAVNMKIIYKISDLYSYTTRCTNPEDVLSAAAYESLMARTVNTTLDTFLSIDRGSLSVSLSKELSEFCKSERLGLGVVQVIIESIHPPVAIADIYQRVVTASINKNVIITNAWTDAQKRLINAEQLRKTAGDYAKAEQYNRESAAKNEMAVYYAAMDAYRINPEAYKLTRTLNTYAALINGNKVYVFSPGMKDYISKFVIGKIDNIIQLNK